MNTTATAAVEVVTEIKFCGCAGITFVATDGTERRLGACRAATTRQFAPGHDARLKGTLIRAGYQGEQVRSASGELMDATGYADLVGGFGRLVREGIARAERNAEAAAARKANRDSEREFRAALRAARKEAKAAAKATPVAATAKVGRWEYEGTLSADRTEFSFVSKKGVETTTTKFLVLS